MFVMNGVIKMGMTIEEHIVQLKKLKSFHNGSYGANINFAIDTIRKYQKIQTILSDWINDDLVGMSDYWMGRIKEVVEDGRT